MAFQPPALVPAKSQQDQGTSWDRLLTIAKLSRLRGELESAIGTNLEDPAWQTLERAENLLRRLPTVGDPMAKVMAVPGLLLTDAEACQGEILTLLASYDNCDRSWKKLAARLPAARNILVSGTGDQLLKFSALVHDPPPQTPVAGEVNLHFLDASHLDHGKITAAADFFAAAGKALGLDLDLNYDYPPLAYLHVQRQMLAARQAWELNNLFVVENCPPPLAGFICCNLRDSLFNLPFHWLWLMENSAIKSVLRPPRDFFDDHLDLGTGLMARPKYGQLP